MAVTKPLAVMVAEEAKVVAALTVRVWLPVAPSTTFALAVTSPLAVMGAVEAKVVAAFTVRLWLPLAPRTVLPAAVKVLLVLLRVTLPENVARPVLSMVRRSIGCPAEFVLLPAVLVLNTKLPPKLYVESCNTH